MPQARTTHVRDTAELAAVRPGMPGPVGVVMTMGALHDGHAALLRAAKASCGSVIATIFVNQLQFGPSEDFQRYPRTLEADLALCAREGADAVFTPDAAQMYPHGGALIGVDPGPLGAVLEGASRPGHFRGVLTAVAKLLHLTQPDRAFFGEKDYQQLTLIQQMSADLSFGVEIVSVPIVRESDGLALSSRNRYLSAAERGAALALSSSLHAGSARATAGPNEVLEAAVAEFDRLRDGCQTPMHRDYLALTDPALGPVPSFGAARLLIAARVGSTRLIDNIAVTLG